MTSDVIYDIIALLDEFLTYREFRNLSLTSRRAYSLSKHIVKCHGNIMTMVAENLNDWNSDYSRRYDEYPWDKIDVAYLTKKIVKIKRKDRVFGVDEFFNNRKTKQHPKFHNLRFYDGENADITYKLMTRLCNWRICDHVDQLTPMEIKFSYIYLTGMIGDSRQNSHSHYYTNHFLVKLDDNIGKLIGPRKKEKLLRSLPEVRQAIKTARQLCGSL